MQTKGNWHDIRGNIQTVERRSFWQISLAFRIQKRMSLACNLQGKRENGPIGPSLPNAREHVVVAYQARAVNALGEG